MRCRSLNVLVLLLGGSSSGRRRLLVLQLSPVRIWTGWTGTGTGTSTGTGDTETRLGCGCRTAWLLRVPPAGPGSGAYR